MCLSVCLSVGRSVGRSVGLSVCLAMGMCLQTFFDFKTHLWCRMFPVGIMVARKLCFLIVPQTHLGKSTFPPAQPRGVDRIAGLGVGCLLLAEGSKQCLAAC